MKKLIISTVIFLLCIRHFALGKNQSPNNELLEEIDIMEAVLSRLIGKNTNGVPRWISNVGFYLDDYGVIFNVAYTVQYNFSAVVFGPEGMPAPEDADNKSFNWINGKMVVEADPPPFELEQGQKLRHDKHEDRTEKKDVIPEIKKVIRSVTLKEVQDLIEEVLTYNDAKYVRKRALDLLKKVSPELAKFEEAKEVVG